MIADLEVTKNDPRDVARVIADGIEAGSFEQLADDASSHAKHLVSGLVEASAGQGWAELPTMTGFGSLLAGGNGRYGIASGMIPYRRRNRPYPMVRCIDPGQVA